MSGLLVQIYQGTKKALVVGGATLYFGLVAAGYAAEGAAFHFKFDFGNPVRSTERILIGIGVRVMAVLIRWARSLLDILYDTSAEVGEWFTQRYASPKTQARIRSRFV